MRNYKIIKIRIWQGSEYSDAEKRRDKKKKGQWLSHTILNWNGGRPLHIL